MTNLKNAKKPVLRLEKVCKNFGGVVAADKISLEIYSGEIFGLIGPNGSGKTTLLNMISGIYDADSGAIYLNGRDIVKTPIHRRAQIGIARTFQHPRLLGRCDIYTNVLVGMDLAAKCKRSSLDESKRLMRQLLGLAGLAQIDLSQSIEKLSYGQQKLLEIVRAILPRPRVLLVDEPAAGLNSREMEHVTALLRVAAGSGVGLLLIEHSMDLIMSLCDRITVLNFGHQIATGVPAEIQTDPAVVKAYLGGDRHARNQ